MLLLYTTLLYSATRDLLYSSSRDLLYSTLLYSALLSLSLPPRLLFFNLLLFYTQAAYPREAATKARKDELDALLLDVGVESLEELITTLQKVVYSYVSLNNFYFVLIFHFYFAANNDIFLPFDSLLSLYTRRRRRCS